MNPHRFPPAVERAGRCASDRDDPLFSGPGVGQDVGAQDWGDVPRVRRGVGACDGRTGGGGRGSWRFQRLWFAPTYSSPKVRASEFFFFFFFFFFCFTLVTGPRRSLSLKLSETRVYEPQIRASSGGEEVQRREVMVRLPWRQPRGN